MFDPLNSRDNPTESGRERSQIVDRMGLLVILLRKALDYLQRTELEVMVV